MTFPSNAEYACFCTYYRFPSRRAADPRKWQRHSSYVCDSTRRCLRTARAALPSKHAGV